MHSRYGCHPVALRRNKTLGDMATQTAELMLMIKKKNTRQSRQLSLEGSSYF